MYYNCKLMPKIIDSVRTKSIISKLILK